MKLDKQKETKPFRVIITDGGYKHTLGAARSLAKEGCAVDVIGSRDCLSRWSRYTSKVAYPQDLFNEEHITDFINFLKDSHYDVLLPIGAKSVQLIARHRVSIEECCHIPLPSLKAIELCLDKDETNRFTAKLGIRVPQTWSFSSLSELEAHIEEIVFPVVVKGKSEIIKDPPFYAYSKEQLIEKIAVWGKQLNSSQVTFPIIQQFIDGNGVGFFALYKHGTCKRVFMHRRLREAPPSGGPSSCAISIYENDLMEVGRKILDALAWHGVAMVEFKRERSTGDLYLIEINPKFWGSLDLALASGVNFPALDVRVAMGEEISFSDKYKIGLKYHWPLEDEINHLKKNYWAIFQILTDCIDPRVKSNVWLSDPLPSLCSTYLLLRPVLSWIINRMGMRRVIYRIRNNGVKYAIIRYYTEKTGIPILKYSRITNMIYVGAQHSTAGMQRLRKSGINVIVNLRAEFDDSQHDLIIDDYCYLPVDEFTAPEINQLKEGVEFIKSQVKEGCKVYIHCSEGISRAPTLAVGFLINKGMTLSDAVALVKKARPFINILPAQMECLSMYAAMNEKQEG